MSSSDATDRTDGSVPLRVVVLDDYQRVAAQLAAWHLSRLPIELDVVDRHIADERELVDRIGAAQVIVAMRERTALPSRVLAAIEGLRLVVTTGASNPSIEPTAGITVCGTDSLVSPAVELTWALILAHRRHLVEQSATVRSGRWQAGPIGEGLEGSTLGLLGLGKIGTRMARIGLAFDMRVIAWSQNLTVGDAAVTGVSAVSKRELFAQSDVLSIHTRLSDRTRGLVGTAEIAQMKPSALLVNTSRGAIVDTPALGAALRDGRIAGAALDAFDVEPIADGDPVLSWPRTLLTPHLGYVVRQNYETYFREALEDIEAFEAGQPIRVISPRK